MPSIYIFFKKISHGPTSLGSQNLSLQLTRDRVEEMMSHGCDNNI